MAWMLSKDQLSITISVRPRHTITNLCRIRPRTATEYSDRLRTYIECSRNNQLWKKKKISQSNSECLSKLVGSLRLYQNFVQVAYARFFVKGGGGGVKHGMINAVPGQFSRHGVGVPIVHNQPLWQTSKKKEKKRSSDPRGGGGGGGGLSPKLPPLQKRFSDPKEGGGGNPKPPNPAKTFSDPPRTRLTLWSISHSLQSGYIRISMRYVTAYMSGLRMAHVFFFVTVKAAYCTAKRLRINTFGQVWINCISFTLQPTGLGGISSSILSVIFTDKFALSQSDARISVAYKISQWKSLTKCLMKCPPGIRNLFGSNAFSVVSRDIRRFVFRWFRCHGSDRVTVLVQPFFNTLLIFRHLFVWNKTKQDKQNN